MNPPKVTWLLPVLNGMPYLRQTLASIAGQSYGHHELLAWDNGSTDGSVDELRRWVPHRLPGRVITGEPLGLGAALARMVEMSRTELCARIDADDINEPDRLARQVERITCDPDLVLVGANIRKIDASGEELGFSDVPLDDAEIRWALWFFNPLKHPAVLFRRDAVLAAGNYRDIKPGQDYDLWLRLARRGRMINFPEPLVRYREHEASVTAQRTTGIHETFQAIAIDTGASTYPAIGLEAGLRLRELLRPGSTIAAQWADLRNHRRLAIAAARQLGLDPAGFRRTSLYASQRRRLWRSSLSRSATLRAVSRRWRRLNGTGPPRGPQLSGSTLEQTNITLLTRMFWPDAFGGVERRTRRMAEAFTEAGVDVRVITQHKEPAAPMQCDRVDPGYTVTRLAGPGIGWRWRWRDRVVAQWWARAIRQHGGAGWLWATDPLPAAGAILAGAGHRLIFNPPWCTAGLRDVHRCYPGVGLYRTRWWLHHLERKAYRHAAKVVVASGNVLDQFRSAYGDRAALNVVQHGVEQPPQPAVSRAEQRQRFGLPADAFVIGLVARLDPCKDVPFLLKAMRDAGDVAGYLLLAGEGPDRERIEQLAHTWGLGDRLCAVGHQSDPFAAYRASDVVVLPSIYEAFGNVVLEAMAAGVPVIGRRRSIDPHRPVLVANEELIEHGRTGYLVDAHDPADLADRLRLLASDRSRLQRMGLAAQAHVARRSWAHAIDEYLAVLGDMVRDQPPFAAAA